MGKVYFNLGVTYFENNDYQSWFIIVSLFPDIEDKPIRCVASITGPRRESKLSSYLLEHLCTSPGLTDSQRNSCPRLTRIQVFWPQPTPSTSPGDPDPSVIDPFRFFW